MTTAVVDPDEIVPIPRRRWIRLAVTFISIGAAATWYEPRADPDGWWVHGLWCAVGFVATLPILLRTWRNSFAVVLIDHRLMFLLAFSLFMLFGGSLLGLGPEWQMQTALQRYSMDARDALRLAGINGMGFGLALLTATLARGRWLGAHASRVAAAAGRVPASTATAAFLCIGGAVVIYRLPYELGYIEGLPSGSVRLLGQLALVAIFVSVSSRGTAERRLRALGITLTIILATLGALTFMKSAVLIPLVALTAGLALRFGSRRVLPMAAVVLVSTYLALGNLANYGRAVVWESATGTSLGDRFAVLQEGWEYQAELVDEERYAWWARLCIVPSEVAAVNLRDAGDGGDGMDIMWWVLVPRVLAPQKPIMDFSAELHTKIFGAEGSSEAMGIFASGYYHGGWGGFVFASLICGWIVAQTSAVARAIHAHRALLLLPFSLLGVNIAFLVADDFVVNFMGLFVFILYPIVAASWCLPRGHKDVRRQAARLSRATT